MFLRFRPSVAKCESHLETAHQIVSDWCVSSAENVRLRRDTCTCSIMWLCYHAEVKSTETVGPVLIHCITQKGKGYVPAETASDKMHGVGPYDPYTGKQDKGKPKVGFAVELDLLCMANCFDCLADMCLADMCSHAPGMHLRPILPSSAY